MISLLQPATKIADFAEEDGERSVFIAERLSVALITHECDRCTGGYRDWPSRTASGGLVGSGDAVRRSTSTGGGGNCQ
ncbi:hypothetical protein [Actinokineospora sp. UTMC 2448]|uniref:hypothetical protein n=1 Tax=Actinokineospora sp. UTMC 2448 TaxID=2268449 RepID=UPI002164CF10|nr:hypothetical protein [Actinokineospora sp. UTMC 2448]